MLSVRNFSPTPRVAVVCVVVDVDSSSLAPAVAAVVAPSFGGDESVGRSISSLSLYYARACECASDFFVSICFVLISNF